MSFGHHEILKENINNFLADASTPLNATKKSFLIGSGVFACHAFWPEDYAGFVTDRVCGRVLKCRIYTLVLGVKWAEEWKEEITKV